MTTGGIKAKRILLVEDNIPNQKVAIFFLKKLACETDVAISGFEALDAVKRIAYDLVLMDCQMPGMDGYEATIKIRQSEDSRRHLPIIAVTGNISPADRDKCMAVGMDGYLAKPILLDQLKAALEKWASPGVLPPIISGDRMAAPAPADRAPELVDENRLRLICDGDAEGLQYLLGVFVTQTQIDLTALEAHVKNQNIKELHRVAHGCAGACETFGITILVPPLRSLEAIAKQGQFTDAVPALLQRAKNDFIAVRQFLRSYRLHSKVQTV